MLTRLLVLLDVILVIAAGTLGFHLYEVGTARPATAAPAPAPAPGTTAAATPAGPAPTGSLATYTVVAERNLFSPTRNEAAPEPPKPTTATPPGPPAPKPRLYGVVIGRDGGSRAYLEDPRTRKVFAYGVGDSVADSRVEQINQDRVVLRRGGETYEVLLRDPTKPRPPAPVAPFAVPGQPPIAPPGSTVPGVPGAASTEIPHIPIPGQAYDPLVQQPTMPGVPVIPGQPPVFPVPGAPAGPPRPIIPGRPATRGVPGTFPTPPAPQAPGTP